MRWCVHRSLPLQVVLHFIIVPSIYGRVTNRTRERARECPYNWQITSTAPSLYILQSFSYALLHSTSVCVYGCVCHFAGGPFTSSGKMHTHTFTHTNSLTTHTHRGIPVRIIRSTPHHCWLAHARADANDGGVTSLFPFDNCAFASMLGWQRACYAYAPLPLHTQYIAIRQTDWVHTFKALPFESFFSPSYTVYYLCESQSSDPHLFHNGSCSVCMLLVWLAWYEHVSAPKNHS